MPKCIDCNKDDEHGLWTITNEGWWLCNECWLDSYDNDNPEMTCAGSHCDDCVSDWECLNYHIIQELDTQYKQGGARK